MHTDQLLDKPAELKARCTKAFGNLTDAYDVLRYPNKRGQYDRASSFNQPRNPEPKQARTAEPTKSEPGDSSRADRWYGMTDEEFYDFDMKKSGRTGQTWTNQKYEADAEDTAASYQTPAEPSAEEWARWSMPDAI